MKVFEQIIGYTPGAVTAAIAGDEMGAGDLDGVFGAADDNARDGATMHDDETAINEVLAAKKSDIVPVVNVIGWRRLWDDIDGEECATFVKLAGDEYWRTQPYDRKRDEVKYLADGSTGERAQELIIVILNTCSGADVRRIDDEVGGVMGLSFDLDGVEQDQFDALKARP